MRERQTSIAVQACPKRTTILRRSVPEAWCGMVVSARCAIGEHQQGEPLAAILGGRAGWRRTPPTTSRSSQDAMECRLWLGLGPCSLGSDHHRDLP